MMVFQLIVLSTFILSVYSSQFPFLNKWFLNMNKQDKNKTEQLLNLRGGADDKDSTGKIKGVCIGIDLGTTYR